MTEPQNEVVSEPGFNKRALESWKSRKQVQKLEAWLDAKGEAKFDARFTKLEELVINLLKEIEGKVKFI